VLGLNSFVLKLPEDGTQVPKHVGVLIIAMSSILLSPFVVDILFILEVHSTLLTNSSTQQTDNPSHSKECLNDCNQSM
jgi:hypothetical protein